MYQTRQTALALRLYRHHEPPVPLGDQRLLQHLGVGGRRDDPLQDLPSLAGRGAVFRRMSASSGLAVSAMVSSSSMAPRILSSR